MLTTADWLLGSNSQSAAGLSTLSDKNEERVFAVFFCFLFTLSEWRHALQMTYLMKICPQYTWNDLSDVNDCAFHSEKLQ